MDLACKLVNDHFQNYKSYAFPKAQLVIADIPYNIGEDAYASNPAWYIDGDRRNGESKKAGKAFFHTDFRFNVPEYFHFCSRLLRKEPKETGQAPCMIVFCAFQQLHEVAETAAQYGFRHQKPLVFVKNYSPQVLKANMGIVGAAEYGLLLYRDKLPKFRNDGQMVFNWFPWERDGKEIPKIHETQKPIKLLKRLIQVFTDPGDVVMDPCAGSGSALRAAYELGRNAYGFECSRDYCRRAWGEMLGNITPDAPPEEYEELSLF